MRLHPLLCSLAAAGALAGAVGCVAGLRTLSFSHREHASQASCAECHRGAARADHGSCAPCHEIDEAKPSSACRTCHPGGAYETQRKRPASYADVRFDHAPHAETACAACHGTQSRGGAPREPRLPAMGECLACHDGSTASGACAACHDVLRADVRPATHGAAWPKVHGSASRGAETSCSWCHTETGCQDCHKTRRPASHNLAWKNSGHGIAADFDRGACQTCHQAAECSRCHQMRPPTHYGAGFRLSPAGGEPGHARLAAQRGGTRSCAVCHDRSFCAGCHPRGF